MIGPSDIARYVNKANVVTAAWRSLFNVVPSRPAVILAMAVAEFETHLGDAGGTWKGEHNWGAVHKRGLTSAESSALSSHGISPNGGEASVKAARAILAPTAPDEALHIDDSPHGKYFVWFYAFPSDVEAAKKFLTTLIANRPVVRSVIDQGTAADVARAMYDSKYYTGVHKDAASNVADYAKNVAAKASTIESALSLAGWNPGHAGTPLDDPSTTRVLVNVAEDRAKEIVDAAEQRSHGFAPILAIGAALGGVALLLALHARVSVPESETRRVA
jgi:hypothetical protein